MSSVPSTVMIRRAGELSERMMTGQPLGAKHVAIARGRPPQSHKTHRPAVGLRLGGRQPCIGRRGVQDSVTAIDDRGRIRHSLATARSLTLTCQTTKARVPQQKCSKTRAWACLPLSSPGSGPGLTGPPQSSSLPDGPERETAGRGRSGSAIRGAS
jgi:hypothetical protein